MTVAESRIALDDVDRPPVRLFFSVASADADLWPDLIERLKRTLSIDPQYAFTSFDMRAILPGEDFLGVIGEELTSYHVGIGLLSSAFLASDVIRGIELSTFVTRKDARFVPAMLETLPSFAKTLSEIQQRQIYAYNEPWASLEQRAQQPWINGLAEAIIAILDKYGDRK